MTTTELMGLLRDVSTFLVPNELCGDCEMCRLRTRISEALSSGETTGSTVLAFLRPSGKWGYAVSPGPMHIGMTEFETEEQAREAAQKAVETNGWPAVPERTTIDVTPKAVPLSGNFIPDEMGYLFHAFKAEK